MVRDRAEGKEVNRRLRILIIIAGALIAIVTVLAIETFLIDSGDW